MLNVIFYCWLNLKIKGYKTSLVLYNSRMFEIEPITFIHFESVYN